MLPIIIYLFLYIYIYSYIYIFSCSTYTNCKSILSYDPDAPFINLQFTYIWANLFGQILVNLPAARRDMGDHVPYRYTDIPSSNFTQLLKWPIIVYVNVYQRVYIYIYICIYIYIYNSITSTMQLYIYIYISYIILYIYIYICIYVCIYTSNQYTYINVPFKDLVFVSALGKLGANAILGVSMAAAKAAAQARGDFTAKQFVVVTGKPGGFHHHIYLLHQYFIKCSMRYPIFVIPCIIPS